MPAFLLFEPEPVIAHRALEIVLLPFPPTASLASWGSLLAAIPSVNACMIYAWT